MPRRREHKPGVVDDVVTLELLLRQPPGPGNRYGESRWANAARDYCRLTGLTERAFNAKFPDRWPNSREEAIAAGDRYRATTAPLVLVRTRRWSPSTRHHKATAPVSGVRTETHHDPLH